MNIWAISIIIGYIYLINVINRQQEEIHGYKDKKSGLKSEIDMLERMLQAEVAKMKNEVTQVQKEKDDLDKELEQAKYNLNYYKGESEKIKSTISKLADDTDGALANELKSRKQSVTELINECGELTKKKDDLNKEYEQFSAYYQNEGGRIKSEYESIKTEYDTLNKKLSSLRIEYNKLDTQYEQKIDCSIPESYLSEVYDAAQFSSDEWADKYDKAVQKSKDIKKSGCASKCEVTWTVNGSRAQGKKQTNDLSKLAVMTFDIIVDRACNYVRANNYDQLKNKVLKQFDKINKLNAVSQITITNEYLKAKLDELSAIHKYRVILAEEKEKSREIKRKALEEKRERQKLEEEERKLQAELNKKKEIEAKAIELLKNKLEKEKKNQEEQKDNLIEIERLNKTVRELEEKIRKAEEDNKASEDELIEKIVDIQEKKELMQSGFVYVISNYGAFGENVFKIGVTRRTDPLDRINELGNASVPFRFNVHSIIPSDEAFKLENAIHKKLRRYRVNLVNNHKEFFKIDINELHSLLGDMIPNLQFTNDITEEQYLETLDIRNNPEKFDEWMSKFVDEQAEDDVEEYISRLGIIDSSVLLDNSNYTIIDEYSNYYKQVAELLDGMASEPALRVTKYYISIYMTLEGNMKKLMTMYKTGDGKGIISFSINGYTGEETKGDVSANLKISQMAH